MKKTLLFVCTFVSFTIIAQAQITKGSILLGGNIGLGKGKMETEVIEYSKSHTLKFNPTVGIAIKENWIVGINAGISDYKSDPSSYYLNKRDEESYSAGVFARRYTALGKNFYLYGDGSINYNKATFHETNNINDERYSWSKSVGISLAPGIAYAINKRFHLEVSLNDLLTAGYTKYDTRSTSHSGGIITSNYSTSKNFGLAANFNTASPFYVGFRFVLGK